MSIEFHFIFDTFVFDSTVFYCFLKNKTHDRNEWVHTPPITKKSPEYNALTRTATNCPAKAIISFIHYFLLTHAPYLSHRQSSYRHSHTQPADLTCGFLCSSSVFHVSDHFSVHRRKSLFLAPILSRPLFKLFIGTLGRDYADSQILCKHTYRGAYPLFLSALPLITASRIWLTICSYIGIFTVVEITIFIESSPLIFYILVICQQKQLRIMRQCKCKLSLGLHSF